MGRRKIEDDVGGRATLTTSVYEQMRTDIVSCILPPGHKLRIDALKERYGLGTSPIREALNRLSSERLVTQQDQRGFVVAPVSLEDLADLTETRCAIYELVLPRSIEQGDSRWEEEVVLALHRLGRLPWTVGAPAKLNPEARRAHRDFHRSLIAACGIPMLIDMMDTLFDLTDRYRLISQAPAPTAARNIHGEHQALADAAVQRRGADAVSIAQAHVRETALRVRSQFIMKNAEMKNVEKFNR